MFFYELIPSKNLKCLKNKIQGTFLYVSYTMIINILSKTELKEIVTKIILKIKLESFIHNAYYLTWVTIVTKLNIFKKISSNTRHIWNSFIST